ncbi:hypothetical protein AB0Y04_00875 [Loigolactobacillus coryniformis]|uniref:hypothetical protein n=1 Tax=Loigolactobacillus coryniformis TaxID=1610 RepID=UPI003F2539B6
MTKVVYMYDQTSREFKGSKLVDDDNYVVQAGETEIKPTDGLYEPVTWNGIDWIGTDQAIWQAAQDAKQAELLKTHPELAPQPTVEQQQLAELIKSNAKQTELNAQLIKQVAEFTANAAHTDTTQEAK